MKKKGTHGHKKSPVHAHHVHHTAHHPKHSGVMWIISMVVVAFAFATIVPALDQVDASGNFFLSAKKIAKKKVVKKPVKAPVATSPAPTTYGSAPTGNGLYRYVTGAGTDTDGWVAWNANHAGDITDAGLTLYFPPEKIHPTGSSESTLVRFYKNLKDANDVNVFGSGYSWKFEQQVDRRLDTGSYDKTVAPANVSRVDAVISTDPADTGMTTDAYAKAFFNAQTAALTAALAKPVAGQPATSCQWSTPGVETKTYGPNSVTTLTYLQVCTNSGWDGPRWSQPIYAFMKGKPSGNLLALYFQNSNAYIMVPNTSQVDPAKTANPNFISEFLSKVDYK